MSEESLSGSTDSPGEGQFVAAPWGPGFVLAMFGLYIVLLSITTSFVIAPPDVGEQTVHMGELIMQLPAQLLLVLAACWASGNLFAGGVRSLGFYRGAFRCLRFGVLAFAVVSLVWWPVAFVFGYLWELVVGKPESQEVIGLVVGALKDSGLGLEIRSVLLLEVVVGAAVAEELLFRALLHGWLRRHFAFVPAAIIGAFLFGIVHVPGSSVAQWHVLFPLGFLGFLLCRVRESRGGLLACIVVHGLYNGTNLALALSGFLPT